MRPTETYFSQRHLALDTWGETGLPWTPRGAMVRIVTHDPDALKAVHEFLEFQIMDHRTGDSATVGKPS